MEQSRRTLVSDSHMLAWTLAVGRLRRSHGCRCRKEQVEMEYSDELTEQNFPPKPWKSLQFGSQDLTTTTAIPTLVFSRLVVVRARATAARTAISVEFRYRRLMRSRE